MKEDMREDMREDMKEDVGLKFEVYECTVGGM